METEQSCGTHKCEEHSKVDFIVKDLTARLDNIDSALIMLGKLSERVALLITLVSISGSVVIAGCIYTFTALPNFKETYATHILETQKQMSANQEDSKNFTRSEVAKINADWSAKLSALDAKISNIENMVREQKYK